MADVAIKTESFEEIFLDENDVFAKGETLAGQGVDNHTSPSADCQKATDRNKKVDEIITEKRIGVKIERFEVKYERDIEIEIEDSVKKSSSVVKEEYLIENNIGEDINNCIPESSLLVKEDYLIEKDIKKDVNDCITESNSVVKEEYLIENDIAKDIINCITESNSVVKEEYLIENDIGKDNNDCITESGVVVKEEYPGEDSIGRQRDHFSEREMYPSCSGWPLLMDSRLDNDNEKKTETGILNADHVKKDTKEVQEPPLMDKDKTKTKYLKIPGVQLDVADRTKKLITATNTDTKNDRKSKRPILKNKKQQSFKIQINREKNSKPNDSTRCLACDSCSFVTSIKYQLMRHVKSHENKKCNICLKKFANTGHLKAHLRVHTGDKPYGCEICDKKFITKNDLNRHQRVHTGERPYSCETCGKKFTELTNFKRHVSLHTGEKPYSCEICGKKFIAKYNFTEHQRVHTGEKPYKCKICNKEFMYSSGFNDHVRRHAGVKPYICEICGKTFTQPNRLKKHMLIHSDDKYSCKICGKKFIRANVLKKHGLIHTGDKQKL